MVTPNWHQVTTPEPAILTVPQRFFLSSGYEDLDERNSALDARSHLDRDSFCQRSAVGVLVNGRKESIMSAVRHGNAAQTDWVCPPVAPPECPVATSVAQTLRRPSEFPEDKFKTSW